MVKAARTAKKIRPTPQAGSYLVCQFWDYLGLTAALDGLSIHKFKGLAVSTLLLVALLFGVLGARSVSDLADKAGSDLVLLECCAVDLLERKQLYRSWVFKSSEQRFGLGYEIVSTCFADPDTSYGLFCDFRLPTAAQQRAQA